MIFAQIISYGFGATALLGVLQILGSIWYLSVSLAQIIKAFRSKRDKELVVRIIQLIFSPLFLFISGAILFSQGWRLDPLLAFQQSLMTVLIIYFIFLDWKRFDRSTK